MIVIDLWPCQKPRSFEQAEAVMSQSRNEPEPQTNQTWKQAGAEMKPGKVKPAWSLKHAGGTNKLYELNLRQTGDRNKSPEAENEVKQILESAFPEQETQTNWSHEELRPPAPRSISAQAEPGGRWQGRTESRQHQHRSRCRHPGVFLGHPRVARLARARVAPDVGGSNCSAGLQQSQRGPEGFLLPAVALGKSWGEETRQVASQCQLLQSSLGRPSSPQLPQLPDEPMSLQNAPGGLFQMPPGDPFPERVTVVWLSVLALTFALVCEPQENLSLAEITLRRLAPRLLISLRLLGPGADVLLRPDAADSLLDRLLPHGQMLFLNERFLQAMDRDMGIKTWR
ncbi:PREDICTED: AP-5 complex subunit sigma-1 [Ficedula albicollis]|uniref:Adaptor related protein complex 5 subunit sigma 1 n=1 Tax=Ficedula albicollis TaxID=59894 RepID=U3KIN4_FICAL|nr:PREDICTED: AP-5 complex subunit sigma-1 [Ficedula albicollis]